LAGGTWTNDSDIVEEGAEITRYGFESVTNRISMEGKSAEFIRLNIE
jgi:hypothetical protein